MRQKILGIVDCALGIICALALSLICLFEGRIIVALCGIMTLFMGAFFTWLLITVVRTPAKEFENDTVRKDKEL